VARETEISEKTCPNVALSTTDPTCLPGSEPGPAGWEASDKQLELRHGLNKVITKIVKS
jgi:hypothetical protein